jgi:hypothetical protein
MPLGPVLATTVDFFVSSFNCSGDYFMKRKEPYLHKEKVPLLPYVKEHKNVK